MARTGYKTRRLQHSRKRKGLDPEQAMPEIKRRRCPPYEQVNTIAGGQVKNPVMKSKTCGAGRHRESPPKFPR